MHGREVVHHLTIAAHGEGQNTFTFGLLHARDAETAAQLRKKFTKQWRKLNRGKRPGWLTP